MRIIAMTPAALADIKVLDLSRVLAGPWCTQTLADLGAEVIKVESLSGDDTRHWGPPFLGEGEQKLSAYFSCVNRNKKSMAVDLKKPEGIALIHQLVRQADVVVENFKTGGAEKLGLGYDTLKEMNPGLVYCAISGYGRTGPRKDLPGYDFIIQAEAGMMSITGPEQGEPFKVGVAIADMITGQNAVNAILAALIARGKTGEGQFIDISLYESQAQWLANVASNTLFSGKDAKRYGNAHANIVPYQAFRATDGWLVLTVGNDRQWQRLCDVLGRPDWKDDPRFATNPQRVENRDVLCPQLADIFTTKSVDDWIDMIDDVGVPVGKVHSVKQVLESPLMEERGMNVRLHHPLLNIDIPVVGSALNLSETPVQYADAPPLTGQHTREVLQNSLNLKPADIDGLVAQGVVGTAK